MFSDLSQARYDENVLEKKVERERNKYVIDGRDLITW